MHHHQFFLPGKYVSITGKLYIVILAMVIRKHTQGNSSGKIKEKSTTETHPTHEEWSGR